MSRRGEVNRNPLLSYQDLLVQTDREARDEYEYDPRELFLRQSGELGTVPDAHSNALSLYPDADDAYTLSEGEDDGIVNGRGDKEYVQAAPKMIKRKQLVVLDTAHRDWTQQSNAYACSFAFGSPTTTTTTTVERFPVYENNRTIPTIATQNSNRVLGVFNSTGFTISAVGAFPAYNPYAPPGRLVGYDTYSNTVKSAFSTSNKLSNVVSMKLARAVLPYRQFFNFNPNLITWYTSSIASGSSVSETLSASSGGATATLSTIVTTTPVSNVYQNMYTTFMTEPYVLLNVNNFQGQYYGGNDPINRAFTVLAQDRRITLNPAVGIGAQYQDYYAWSDEEFTFNSPLATIPKFDISLAKNNGQAYQQIDDLQIVALAVYTNTSNANFAKAGWPTPSNPNTGACLVAAFLQRQSGTPGAPPVGTKGWVSRTELRPGDRISFHSPTMLSYLNSPEIAANQYGSTYMSLFNWMYSNDATVVYTTFANGYNLLSDDQSYPWINTIVFPYDVANYDGFVASSNLLNQSAFPVVLGADPAPIPGLNRISPSNNYIIPILNNNMQASFAFEMTCLVPDVASLSSTPPR